MAENHPPIGLCMIVRRLALFLLCVIAFECLLIAIGPRWHSGSVLKRTEDALLFRVRNDSWAYMAKGDLAWQQHPNRIYESTFFEHDVRFIYPPTSLFLYRVWQAASIVHVRPFTALKITLVLAFLGTWIVVCQFFFALLPRANIRESTGIQRWMVRLMLLALTGTFLPLINALYLGQVQTLLNFVLILAAALWMRGGRKAPGILIGLACWLKPQSALFLIWGLFRRQWSFAISLVVALSIGLVLSVSVFGFHNSVEYLAVLHFLSRHGDALATNQSLNGLLHRVLHVGSPVTWVYGYPRFSRTIYIATICSSSLLMLAALIVPTVRRIASTVTDFLIFAMAAVMASPIAWEHHYGIFFVVFLLWMPEAFRRWPTFFGLLAMYMLMTDTWAPLTPLMYTRWTFALSHVYYGGTLLLLWTLFHKKTVFLGTPSDSDSAEKASRCGNVLQPAKAAHADA